MPVNWSQRNPTPTGDLAILVANLFCQCGHRDTEHDALRGRCGGEESYFKGHLPDVRACLCLTFRVEPTLSLKHARSAGASDAVTRATIMDYVRRQYKLT